MTRTLSVTLPDLHCRVNTGCDVDLDFHIVLYEPLESLRLLSPLGISRH